MKSNYEKARRRVKKKSDFRSHLVSYVVTIAFLFAINLWVSPGYLWATWAALGWGLGLAFHGFEAYGIIADKDKEEEMIQEEMRKMELNEGGEYLEDDDQLELREIRKEVRYDEDDFV